MVIKYTSFIFFVASLAILNAFHINPNPVLVTAGGEADITLTAQDPKEYLKPAVLEKYLNAENPDEYLKTLKPDDYLLYRLEIENGPSYALSFYDNQDAQKEIYTIRLGPKPVTFRVKASDALGTFIVAFDYRPIDQLYTGELVFARQGVRVVVLGKGKKLDDQ